MANQSQTKRHFHRMGDDPKTIQLIIESGELWGQPARNTFASNIPAVKAYDGALPPHKSGFEFTTDAVPNPGCVPGKPVWSGNRPGVRTEHGFAKIRCTVVKVRP